MLWMLVGAALAGAPSGVDLTDPSSWEAQADALLEGPSGCWEVVGRADWRQHMGRYASYEGTAIFAGRLDEGAWVDILVEPLGEIQGQGRTSRRVYTTEQHFSPLVGRHKPGSITVSSGGGQARSEMSVDQDAEANRGLRDTLEELTGNVETSWVSWDEERGGVVLHRASEAKGSKDLVESQVFFPGGGLAPTAHDVHFPARMRLGGVPSVKIKDAQVQIRGQRVGAGVFPLAEAYSFVGTVLGMEFSMAQTIRYIKATPCGPVTQATLERSDSGSGQP